jgi:hypothetical protein
MKPGKGVSGQRRQVAGIPFHFLYPLHGGSFVPAPRSLVPPDSSAFSFARHNPRRARVAVNGKQKENGQPLPPEQAGAAAIEQWTRVFSISLVGQTDVFKR